MRKIIIIIFSILLICILYFVYKNKNIEYIKNNFIKDKLNYNILSIDKLKLVEIVNEANIDSKNITQVVMFKGFGKPNIKNTNTILAAHSGSGFKAKFKDLEKIYVNDNAKFYYEGKVYTYKVIEKFYIHEKDLIILNNIKDKTTLTLMTCDAKNDEYRLIVILELIDFN